MMQEAKKICARNLDTSDFLKNPGIIAIGGDGQVN